MKNVTLNKYIKLEEKSTFFHDKSHREVLQIIKKFNNISRNKIGFKQSSIRIQNLKIIHLQAYPSLFSYHGYVLPSPHQNDDGGCSISTQYYVAPNSVS